MKKIMKMLMAAVLGLSGAFWSADSPVQAANLVANGGFEAGTANWVDWGNSTVVTGHAQSGTRSLRTGTGAGGRGQDITSGFTVGETYRLTASGKVDTPGEIGFVGLAFYDGSGNKLSGPLNLVFTSTSYTTKTLDAVIPAGTVRITVFVWKDAGVNGMFYADDISLDISPNLVRNAGFENGNTDWVNWGASGVQSGQGYYSTYAIRVGPGAGGRGQDIASGFTVGSTYTLTARGKTSVDGEIGYIGVDFYNSANTKIGGKTLSITSQTYARASTDFTVPPGTARLTVWVWKDAGTGGYFYADDIVVTPAVPIQDAVLTVSYADDQATLNPDGPFGANMEFALMSDAMWTADGQWAQNTLKATGMKMIRWGYGGWDWDYAADTYVEGQLWWGGSNPGRDAGTLGLDEFLDYCIATGTIPLIMLPFDYTYYKDPDTGTYPYSLGDAKTKAQQMVSYVHSRGVTNAYFELGNEPWLMANKDRIGDPTRPQYYADQLVAYSSIVKSVNSNYKLVASVNPYDPVWLEKVFSTAAGSIDAVDYHVYPEMGSWNNFFEKNDDDFTIDNAYQLIRASQLAYAPGSNIEYIIGEFNVLLPDWSGHMANDLQTTLMLANAAGSVFASNRNAYVLTWPSHWPGASIFENREAYGLFDYDQWSGQGETTLFTGPVSVLKIFNQNVSDRVLKTETTDPKVRVFAFSDQARTRLNLIVINKRSAAWPVTIFLPDAFDLVNSFKLTGTSLTDKNPVYEPFPPALTAPAGSALALDNLPAHSVTVFQFAKDGSTGVPGSFMMTAPAGGATGVSTWPLFAWNAASGAANYKITVSTQPNFANPIISEDVGNRTNFQATRPLQPGTTYYWRVVASNKNGTVTAVNSGSSFTTAAAASVTTLTLQNGLGGYSGNVAAYVSQSNPTTNYLNSDLVLGGSGTSNNRLLVKFDALPTLPSNAEILSARLKLTVKSNQLTGDFRGTVHRVLKGWTPSGVTWNSTGTQNWTTAGVRSLAQTNGDISRITTEIFIPSNKAAGTRVSIDVTQLVDDIYQGAPNHGFMLTGSLFHPLTGSITFHDDTDPTVSNRPLLEITYRQ